MKNRKIVIMLLGMLMACTACGSAGSSASSEANDVNFQDSQKEQNVSDREDVVFPELTPLEYWNQVDTTFLEANAPADLAKYYEELGSLRFSNHENKVVGNFGCNVYSKLGLAVIHSYVGPNDISGELVVPAEVDGCRVLNVYLPELPSGVTSLVVEEGIQQVSGCDSETLTSVTLPETLLILWNALDSCTLTEIEFPDSLYVLWGCANTQLTEVVIPENVIYVNGFSGTPLSTVTFEGNHVLAIGQIAFKRCNQLTDIEIPDSVLYIHPEAFMETPVTVPDDRIFYD